MNKNEKKLKKDKKMNLDLEVRLLDSTTPFAIREAFNHLRTNLMYTLNDEEGCPVFAVTSAGESAGKSTLMANVAISYAMANKKVLLIDADMRAPMQYRIFSKDKEIRGLSELLSGIETDDTKLIVSTETPGVELLLAGLTPPNPSELIMSNRFEQYLKKWRMSYDAIFIDFPPVGIVTDTLAVHKLVTGYIFVIRSDRSDGRTVAAALDTMKKVDAKILGIVLNDINPKHYGNYSYRKSGYGKSKYSRYSKKHEGAKYESSYENAYERAHAMQQAAAKENHNNT